MDTDSDGQISVAELIAWVKKNSEQVGQIDRLVVHSRCHQDIRTFFFRTHVNRLLQEDGALLWFTSGSSPGALLQWCGHCSQIYAHSPPPAPLPACLQLHTYTIAGTRGPVQRDLFS